jgi:hypothetical protein
MYFEALSDVERRRAATPRPIGDAVELVQRYVDELDAEDEFLADLAAPSAESALAARLKSLAAAVGQPGQVER